MDNDIIPVDIQRVIIEEEITRYRGGVYLISVRHRVNKKLGNEDAAKANAEEMVKQEQAIDELKAILKELDLVNGKVKA